MIRRWIRQYKEVYYLAYHDSLTGLLNRNWLYKNKGNIRKKYVYFIDINNLRDVNKNGHTAGDEHIKRCVKSIKHTYLDILIRYAGDEFILFSDTYDIVTTNKLYSVGCSIVNGGLDKAINNADQAMIKSKLISNHGR